MSSENDKTWLLARFDSANEDKIEYFCERVAVMIDNGMPIAQARSAGLVLLCDYMKEYLI